MTKTRTKRTAFSPLITLRYGAATVTCVTELGCLTLTLRGPITRRVLEQVKVDTMRAIEAGPRAFVLVVDMRLAVLAIGLADLTEVAIDSHMHGAIDLPIAFVVTSEQQQLMLKHGAVAIDHGLTRVAFVGIATAYKFAARKVVFGQVTI